MDWTFGTETPKHNMDFCSSTNHPAAAMAKITSFARITKKNKADRRQHKRLDTEKRAPPPHKCHYQHQQPPTDRSPIHPLAHRARNLMLRPDGTYGNISIRTVRGFEGVEMIDAQAAVESFHASRSEQGQPAPALGMHTSRSKPEVVDQQTEPQPAFECDMGQVLPIEVYSMECLRAEQDALHSEGNPDNLWGLGR
jgi:hypothetical protein